MAGLGLLAALMASACARNEPPAPPTYQPRPPQRSSVDPKTGTSASPRLYAANTPIPKGGGTYKVGVPYQVSGRWYYPKDDPGYDRTGVASWYGDDFHGRKTANGEIYDMMALSAAHTTLPMPSYVWVTNLDNNRTVLVRINDRGPYAHDRVIDLSRAAARALGSEIRGLSHVRVRYAGPAPLNGDDRREQAFLRGQPWFGAIAQSPGRPPNRSPHMRPYADAGRSRPTADRLSADEWQPAMALGAPKSAKGKAATARASEALDAPIAANAASTASPATEARPATAPTSRLLIAGAFRSEANARTRITQLTAFGAFRMVAVTSALGTIYEVRSEPMEAAAARQLQAEMTAAGIKDLGLAGRTARPVTP